MLQEESSFAAYSLLSSLLNLPEIDSLVCSLIHYHPPVSYSLQVQVAIPQERLQGLISQKQMHSDPYVAEVALT